MPRQKTIPEIECCLTERIDAVARNVAALELVDAGAAFGNATLVGGTIAVANIKVTANSIIVIGRKTIGGTVGNMSYTLSAGVGFTINSSSGTDTSVVSYHIKY